mmetsp:Transcript_16194/g.24453  ORF Transcript_16194/g.24453 Transcript_16194/m.24453 type:complete len:232 (-) Transcript_16194:107-802(-)
MSKEDIIKKYNIKIIEPKEGVVPTGITIFLPGTLLSLKDYSSTYNVIVEEQHQIVIGFEKMNPFSICGGRTHQRMAEDVASMVQEFRSLKEYNLSSLTKYNMVGHSLGGKVALLVAAKYDIPHVKTIVALDPVDDKPRELTAPDLNSRTNLENSQAKEIHLFQSAKGGDGWIPLCPSDRNATVIQNMYPKQITSLTINQGAGHMSYKDTTNDEASVQCREMVQRTIRAVIR